MTSQAPLQLANIMKRYKDGEQYIEVIKDLSFHVHKGEFVAVIGPSGSGKSTFLSIAGALLSPDEGKVLVNGEDIATYPDKAKADVRLRRIGYIFQSANLVPYLRAKDQLKLVSKMAGKWSKTNEKRVKDLLNGVGLSSRNNHFPHQLSGGEKQRVAIARAFMNEPDIILADEPTANLDGDRSTEIVELIAKEVKDKEKAAVMVTHDENLLKYCDRIYRLADGQLTLEK